MQRIRSAINRLFFEMRKRRRWTRRNYQEVPAGMLKGLDAPTTERINHLKKQYRLNFESYLNQENALENYLYLELLDHAFRTCSLVINKNPILVDVGSRTFYYASLLYRFFNPAKMTGIELDAFPLFDDFHTRYSYAQFYIRELSHAHYLAKDFLEYDESYSLLTLFYPFVTSYPHVAWKLPLSHFQPGSYFRHAYSLLDDGGQVVMVNHGASEWAIAERLMLDAGFQKKGHVVVEKPLIPRDFPPVVSVFEKR